MELNRSDGENDATRRVKTEFLVQMQGDFIYEVFLNLKKESEMTILEYWSWEQQTFHGVSIQP